MVGIEIRYEDCYKARNVGVWSHRGEFKYSEMEMDSPCVAIAKFQNKVTCKARANGGSSRSIVFLEVALLTLLLWKCRIVSLLSVHAPNVTIPGEFSFLSTNSTAYGLGLWCFEQNK